MKETYDLLGYSDLIQRTDNYLKRNFLFIFILGLGAGIGRFIQEGGQGEISSIAKAILEVVVNGARLLIVLIIIGQGYVQAGIRNFTNIFRLTKSEWLEVWTNVKYNLSNNFISLLVNFIIYIVIAVVVNVVLFSIFEFTPFVTWLKSVNLLNPAASKWPVLLFFKNISIIPFTLIFETLFVIWIVQRNKLIKP
ncbi:hypothetical protein [Emticicia sp. BO119]|uniref:hypothetical protein n=1 Tax=Emticicia sp. BO119 TaxID=2757768 RepID=UPI0015EFE7F5|nr:hypothetical protein [Emticicia sp. BO119]MBA4852845.1 hypothetical protein [Emticicia sp. BO119]